MNDALTSAQALDIAVAFQNAAKAVGDYRLRSFKAQRLDPHSADALLLKDYQWDLLGYSNSFVTEAVGIMLAAIEPDLAAIIQATHDAQDVVTRINRVKDIIAATAALVELGGAIALANPGLIVSKAAATIKVAKAIFEADAPPAPIA